jgi:phage gp46-like protein
MSIPVDAALTYIPELDIYDITLAPNGDLTPEYGFYTSLVISTFCERRADQTEVAAPQYRRGWWGNLFANIPGFEIGSKLWIISQARNNSLTLNRAINFLQEAYQWYVDDKHLQKVIVNGAQTDFGIIITVELLRYDNTIINISYNLWEETIAVLGL